MRARLLVDGLDFGEMDGVTGGDATPNMVKTRLGSNSDMTVTIGGPKDHDDVTITLKMRVGASTPSGMDYQDVERYLLNRSGFAPVQVSRWILDGQGIPSGAPLTHSGGTLGKVTPVQFSNESSTVAMITFVVTGGKWS